ncbi:cilia- and flagella-associated protein 45-like isoform X1 [Diaphorina citri]|uniref:Cilia- and flagella-associated protein 45 n=1 Tax=Diaphorina citri TaxID=121845 RepID=A0A3Q0J3F4_DIACI|nr:cilia- and flagella-associated protein 45-like isoform X1 [Diaphorina citri]KAI5750717.1 hypothetical protein M8J77_000703 [Diaphorina citri]
MKKYKTKTQCRRDEVLDGLKGFPQDGRKRVTIIANDHARVVLIPEENRSSSDFIKVKESKYESLIDVTRRPNLEERQEYVNKMKEDNIKRETNLMNIIKSVKIVKPKLSTLESKEDEEKRIREKHIKQRAEALRLEEEDVMKLLNSEIARAKCSAIQQKQIDQKLLKEKVDKEMEEKRVKDMLERNEFLFYKAKTKDEEQKRDTKKKFVEFLEKQVKVKEVEKSLRKKEIEQEITEKNLRLAQQNKKDLEELLRREEDRRNLLNHNKNSILEAQKLKEKEIEEEKILSAKMEDIWRQKDEQQKSAQDHFNRQLEERNKVFELLAKQKKEENELRLEAEEFAMRRRNNEFDREWRQKEKERILNELEKRKSFQEGILRQIDDKYKQKTIEIIDELKEVQKMANKLKDMDSKIEEHNKKLKDEKQKMTGYIVEQAQEKLRKEEQEKVETEIWRNKIKDMEQRRKEKLRKAIEKKIEDLRSHDISDELINSVRQKADILESKIQ